MAQITLPHPLTDGTTPFGSEVRANDDACVAVINGGLADDNFAAAAKLKGTRFSTVPGARIPADRIEDLAVTSAKASSDAAIDANRCAGTDHFRDGTLTRGKFTTTAGLKMAYNQVDIGGLGYQPIAFSVPSSTDLALVVATLVQSGGKYGVEIGVQDVFLHVNRSDYFPAGDLPVSGWAVLGLLMNFVTFNGFGRMVGTVYIVAIPLS